MFAVAGMWVWHQRAAFESFLCHLLAGMMNPKHLEQCLAHSKHQMNIPMTAVHQEIFLRPPVHGPVHVSTVVLRFGNWRDQPLNLK